MELDLIVMWEEMGLAARLVIIALTVMSIAMITISVERWLTYRRNRQGSNALVSALGKQLQQNGAQALGQVEKLCEEHQRSPLSAVVKAASEAFKRRHKNIEAMDLVLGINRAVERSIDRQSDMLKRGLGTLATIASLSPFVGLLGTVMGIITAFQNMAATGAGGLASVSGGIAEALVATAFGLFVAIPAVGLYNHFNRMVEELVVDMNEVAAEMVETVVFDRGA